MPLRSNASGDVQGGRIRLESHAHGAVLNQATQLKRVIGRDGISERVMMFDAAVVPLGSRAENRSLKAIGPSS